MRKRKIYVAIALLIAVLFLGVGYAAIGNIELNITGSATAAPDDANFVVKFATTPAPTTTAADGVTVEATRTGDQTATISVTGMTKKGETATATYTIKNESPDLSANLSASIKETETNKNTQDTKDYFDVSYSFGESGETATVKKGETTTITVTVTLKDTPVDSDITSDIVVTITAAPVQATTN